MSHENPAVNTGFSRRRAVSWPETIELCLKVVFRRGRRKRRRILLLGISLSRPRRAERIRHPWQVLRFAIRVVHQFRSTRGGGHAKRRLSRLGVSRFRKSRLEDAANPKQCLLAHSASLRSVFSYLVSVDSTRRTPEAQRIGRRLPLAEGRSSLEPLHRVERCVADRREQHSRSRGLNCLAPEALVAIAPRPA